MKKAILLVLTFCLSLSCGTAGLLLIQGSGKSDTFHNVNTPQVATLSTVIADSGMSKYIASVPTDSCLSLQNHFEEEAVIENNPQLDYGFELPVKGATGYGVIAMNLHKADGIKTPRTGVVGVGVPFEIIGDGKTCFNIRLENGTTGWVTKNYTMINLPDVIPSIVYKNSNGSASLFRSHGRDLSVTGEKLYESLAYNARLEKDEYTMPVLFNMAVKIAAVQHDAMLEGNTLVLYEGYRPMSAQTATKNALVALMSADSAIRRSINSWGSSWFIANGVSNHQQGYAIDVSLASITSIDTLEYGSISLKVPKDYEEYEMPTPIHELSPAAATLTHGVNSLSQTVWKSVPAASTMNDSAFLLQRYCVDNGLTPLASEWWHFNDLDARRLTGGAGKGQFVPNINLSVKYEFEM